MRNENTKKLQKKGANGRGTQRESAIDLNKKEKKNPRSIIAGKARRHVSIFLSHWPQLAV